MIYLNGQLIRSVSVLSQKAQSILSMIPGGKEWFNWAITSLNTPSISSINEIELLEMVQLGLNNEIYIRFNTFRTTIHKLFFLDEHDVQNLAEIRKTERDNEVSLKSFFEKEDIISYSQVNKAIAQLREECNSRPDIFELISFEDMQYLVPFLSSREITDNALQKKSKAFALKLASTITDFINLSKFYQQLAVNRLNSTDHAQHESDTIEAVFNQIRTSVPEYLYSPSIGALTGVLGFNEQAITQGINLGMARHQYIGYTSISSAALNLVRNLVIGDKPDPDLREKIGNYLHAVKNTFPSLALSEYSLLSDGRTVNAVFAGNGSLVAINIDSDGNLSLLPETTLNSH